MAPDKVETRFGALHFLRWLPRQGIGRETLRQPRLPARRAGLPARACRR
ncbi:MAG: hypothetical protein MZW92_70850 [Comamonadaceae bacterium]|nr:hypothetical protein [Comamonadaceae bacterium]